MTNDHPDESRRKPISKRLRYEILRRDANTCRYCGASAPDVRITVDHVVPVALGGTDDPSNLVAACVDCNAGKSSSTADAALVEDVNEQALQWRQLTDAAGVQLRAERDAQEAFAQQAWAIWDRICGHWSAPYDASITLERWYQAGVTLEDVQYAAGVTAVTRGVTYHWSYFCGIVHKHLKKRDALAQQWYREANDPTSEGAE